MSTLQNKIDFSMIITAKNANPNGDPLNGNRPRENYDGMGEISDVCIKRKIRNRLQDMGERIFVQSDDRCDDGEKSLKDRADHNVALKAVPKGKPREFARVACAEWIDVRSFGQVFAFRGSAVSIGVRGPVSIRQAVSVSPVDIISMKITKSVNSVNNENGKEGKGPDTMGDKHRVEFGLYVVHGSINCQLAEKTGFTDEDAEKIKQALMTLFENDSSSARPDGSMEVCRLYWWKHDCKTPRYSSAKIHRLLQVQLKDGVSRPSSFADYDITLQELEGIQPEIIDLM